MTLISGTELAGRLGGPNLRIIDTRWSLGRPGAGREAYEAGHIPGAIHLDLDTDLSAPPGQGAIGGLGRHPLPSPQAFAARMAAAGIGDDDLVVAYDESDGGVAARLWWMLDALGHERVAVLDGGWRAWQEAGLPVSTDPTTATDRPPARLRLAAAWPRTIERRDLAERLGSVVLLDARAPERYRGEIEPIDPLAGHIPTARNSPLARNIGPD
ncbi:MAG TPA: rhodanese-like domain-containing protein, partial [Candidatus Limnocylindrales bacterium]|nr:rhodanese-like domain-containing protein [Candidatus Limnocylindrales bacterium]